MEDREKYLREIQQIAHEEALKLREAGFTEEYEGLKEWMTVWRLAETLKAERLSDHLERWKTWRNGNTNGKLHQFLVLIGLATSPTMEFTWTEAERERFRREMDRVMNGSFTATEQAEVTQ